MKHRVASVLVVVAIVVVVLGLPIVGDVVQSLFHNLMLSCGCTLWGTRSSTNGAHVRLRAFLHILYSIMKRGCALPTQLTPRRRFVRVVHCRRGQRQERYEQATTLTMALCRHGVSRMCCRFWRIASVLYCGSAIARTHVQNYIYVIPRTSFTLEHGRKYRTYVHAVLNPYVPNNFAQSLRIQTQPNTRIRGTRYGAAVIQSASTPRS